jgi:hypothetical protein
MPRLPTPGADNGAWGNILNEYLRVEHSDDGTHKPLQELKISGGSPYYDASTFGPRIGQTIRDALAAIPAGSTLVLDKGEWLWDGITIDITKQSTRLSLASGCILRVPIGSTGTVFRILGGATGNRFCQILGPGEIREGTGNGASTPADRLCTAIELEADEGGCTFHRIGGDLIIWNAGVVVRLKVRNLGWINANTLEDLIVYYPRAYMEWDVEGVANRTNLNTFMNWRGQSHPTQTIFGFKDVSGHSNLFMGNVLYDMHAPGAVATRIAAEALFTVIIGGAQTQVGYTDLGAGTRVMDRYQGASVDALKMRSREGAATATILAGSGDPNGSVSAPAGSVYLRTDGAAGTSFYVKESGTGKTGWMAK